MMHRDLKLNNLAFCINMDVDSTAAGLDGCSRDARLCARILDFGEAVQHRSENRGPTSYDRCRSEYASIARHNGDEQGFKDDLELLLYAFLDKLMTGGLPWKQHSEGSQRLGRNEMKHMKVDFCRFTGQRSEMRLVNMLSTLDNTPARADPPYHVLEAALKDAWQDKWREHQSCGGSNPKRLHDCIKMVSGT